MGTEVTNDIEERSLELVRTLCARAELPVSEEDIAAAAAILETHHAAFKLVRALELPHETDFAVTWR